MMPIETKDPLILLRYAVEFVRKHGEEQGKRAKAFRQAITAGSWSEDWLVRLAEQNEHAEEVLYQIAAEMEEMLRD